MDDEILLAYAIGTWSKYVQQSEIEEHFTVQDKPNLPKATENNRTDRMKWVITLAAAAQSDCRIWVDKVAKATHLQNEKREAVMDAFESALGD
jgi:hypothetical protein